MLLNACRVHAMNILVACAQWTLIQSSAYIQGLNGGKIAPLGIIWIISLPLHAIYLHARSHSYKLLANVSLHGADNYIDSCRTTLI